MYSLIDLTSHSAKRTAFVLIVILGLVTAFWWPTLFQGKSLIHGDSIPHGLPVLELLTRTLHGDETPLWTEKVFGGHPLFAESTGAFAHPLNLLIAWFIPPVYGHNLFHFICTLIVGFGTFGFCRSLGTSPFAAGFGALSVTFAPIWMDSQQNLAIGGALAWVPAMLWAMEAWLKHTTIRNSILLATIFCLTVLAGYPQVVHGAILYMAASFASIPVVEGMKSKWIRDWRKLLATAGIAAAVGLGLSAIQLLPLMELAALSHRSGGIELFLPIRDPSIYVRGFIFSTIPVGGPILQQFPGTGSLLVCAVTAAVLLVEIPARIKCHLIATALLLVLGFGLSTPLSRMLYRCHLIPGLHYFRTTAIYLNIAIVGMAALAATAIDKLTDYFTRNGVSLRNRKNYSITLIFFLVWISAACFCYIPSIQWHNFIAGPLAIVGMAILVGTKRTRLIPAFLFAILTVECVTLRFHEFKFGNANILKYPASLAELSPKYHLEDYKFADISYTCWYAMSDPRENHEEHVQRFLSAVSSLSNLMWGVSSIDGALALPLRPRKMLDPVFDDEIRGRSTTVPGQRAIDLLGVRFITVNGPRDTPGFRVAYHDPSLNVWIMENTAALPRFQTYTHAVVVPTADDVLALLKRPRDPELIIEDAGNPNIGTNNAPNDSTAITYQVRKAVSTKYIVDVDAKRPGWLFLADANYPGWNATVDGQPSKVYTAQLLGKAVAVPVGKHKVELEFFSLTFRNGLIITCLSALAAILLLVYEWLFIERTKRMDFAVAANPSL